MKKWLKRGFYSFLILLLIAGITFFAFYKRFAIEAPKKEYPKAQNSKEAQLQDLDYVSLYITVDRSFDTEKKRTAFTKEIDRLKTLLPLSKSEFEMAIAKLMAIADNTHTNIHPSSRARRLNAIPLRFYWFEDGLYTVLVQSDYKDLLGVKITAINGYAPNELLQKLKPWYGGATTRLKFFSPLYFMSPELLHTIGYGVSNNSMELTYLNTSGKEEKIIINTSEAYKNTIGFWPPNWLNSSLMKSKTNWYGLHQSTSPAIPFQNTHLNVFHTFLDKGLYVQLNENKNIEALHINNYLKNVLKQVKKNTLESVVLDLRFNPGGDYHISRSFIKNINKQLYGKPFYIITGNGTFSAGIMTTAIAKHTAKDKARIIGENVGDRLQFWADGGSIMRLPNSKISLRIWTAYHDWKNGCNDWSRCFWITIFDGLSVNSVNPDIEVPLKFKDYMNGEDTVLKTILSLK